MVGLDLAWCWNGSLLRCHVCDLAGVHCREIPMELLIDGVEYYVRFEHYPYEKHEWGRGATECQIKWIPKKSKSGDRYVICERTYCSSSDRFNECDGRKESLTRALKPFTRDVRTLFWAEYERV